MLVADLRLDNREELAAVFGMGAAELRVMPDSALLLRAYKRWGEACAEHLLGDFAFAIWDGRAKKLVLGRDHMGQRYVHLPSRQPDFFVFATEVEGVVGAIRTCRASVGSQDRADADRTTVRRRRRNAVRRHSSACPAPR